MGLCASQNNYEGGLTPQEKRHVQQEREINKTLNRQQRSDGQSDRDTKKLLLLGAGESGKSTLFKQLITIYGKGFPPEERLQFEPVIRLNVIACLVALYEAAPNFGGPIACQDSLAVVKALAAMPQPAPITKQNVNHLKRLWNDSGIRAAYENRSKFQLFDCADYFLDRLDAIVEDNYVPTEQDVLRTRVRTTGIVETAFEINHTQFKMVDVGGQRTERKKWIHCFEGVTAIIFIGVLSEYDLMLYEDHNVNRLQETLVLFEEICNSKWFAKTSIILFLNKRDLFEQKIRRVPLTVCPVLAGYKGPMTYEAGCQVIEQQFTARNKNPENVIYVHITCATDTNNIAVVFDSCKDIIIRRSLGEVGLL